MTFNEYKEICDYLKRLTADTRWEGHIYTVGGCCRDAILGREIQDVDLAIDLPGGGVDFPMWLYERHLTAGKPVLFPKYCTSKFRLRAFPSHELEAVQTRSEKYTKENSRNPETVFGSLEEDCKRRDLTINSLYYDITNDSYLDLTGTGIDDIKNGIIRTPMAPDQTYDDDPVRILRTIRFASRYGWPIEPEALAAMKRNVHRLDIIKPERMHQEFDKLLNGPNVKQALQLLLETGALKWIFPLLYEEQDMTQGPEHDDSLWAHTLNVVEAVPPETSLRLAALLHDIGKLRSRVEHKKKGVIFPHHEMRGADMAKKMLRRLKYPLEVRDEVAYLIASHHLLADYAADGSDIDLKRVKELLSRAGSRQLFEKLLILIDAENNQRIASKRKPLQIKAVKRLLDSIPLSNKRRSRHHRRYRPRRQENRKKRGNA